MTKKECFMLSIMFSLLFAGIPALAVEQVPVGNPGFDDFPTSGGFTYNFTPWQTDGDAWVTKHYYTGEPESVPAMYTTEAHIFQVLGLTYLEGETYEFSIDVGTSDQGATEWMIYIYDATDGEPALPLAVTNDPNTAMIPGEMATQTVRYTATADVAGHTIGIGFTGDYYALFDNALVTATATQPIITTQPQSSVLDSPRDVTFTVSADSDSTIHYQWKKYVDGENDLDVGSDSDTFTITAAGSDDEGFYYCILTNENGSTRSKRAGLVLKRLVGWWKFDGDLSDSVADVQPGAKEHNGSYTDNSDPNYVEGISGSAIDFKGDDDGDGRGEVVLINDSATDFNFYPMGFTVNCWIRSGHWDWGAMVSKQNKSGSAVGFTLNHYRYDGVFSVRRIADDLWSSGIDIIDNQWHMITGKYDQQAGVIQIYVDGRLRNQATVTGLPEINDEPLVIGAETAAGEVPFIGKIDDIRIWNYPLDPLSIGRVYGEYKPEDTFCFDLPLDVNGPDGEPDCIVDLYDFMIFNSEWLVCNLVPVTACP